MRLGDIEEGTRYPCKTYCVFAAVIVPKLPLMVSAGLDIGHVAGVGDRGIGPVGEVGLVGDDGEVG